MEKDILAHMEALTTQANDADSVTAPAGPLPTVQTPLKDATLPESNGESVGQKSMGQAESDEVEKRSVLSWCPSAGSHALCLHVTPIHAALQEANSRRNARNKNSRKRRNIKKKRVVFIPWPLILQTRASSAAPVLGFSCVMEAHTGVNVAGEETEQVGSDEKENTSVLTKPLMVPSCALWLATSPFQPSSEGPSLAANEEIIVGQTSSHKERNEKDKKIVGSPWPLTVQAWASFTGPAKVQTPFAGASASAISEVNMGHRSRSQKCEMDENFIGASYQSTQAGVPTSAVTLGQATSEGAPLTANSKRNIGQKSSWNSKNRKEKSDLAGPWPLTVQAWASFTTTGPVQTLFQGNSSTASMVVNERKNRCAQLQNSEKETKPILPWRVRVKASAPFSATAPRQASFEEVPSLGRDPFQGEPNQEEA